MSSDFEWHFGDEFPEDEPEEKQAEQPRWRRLIPWLLTLLVVAAGATIWWLDRQRNLAEAEAEVEQVAQLELQALTEGDSELYLSLQDYYDRSWKRAQAAYVDTAGLPLPLQDVTTPVSTAVESARVVGDRARVEVVHTTTLPSGEEAIFRAVRFYRYMPDGRWMHTHADPDAVRGTVTFVVDEVEITALDEDADWVNPLAGELAAAADRFCNLASCGKEPSVALNLAANLEEGAEPDDDVLPAPFLMGAPENEAALEAWKASLADFLVDRLVAQEIRAQPDDELGGVLFEERLRAWLKAELEVSERIVPDSALLRTALDSDAWFPTWRLWYVPPDDPARDQAVAQIDLLLAFIEEAHGSATVAGLFTDLHDVDHLSELLSGIEGPSADLKARFVSYARKQTAEATGKLASFDRYDLLIGCSKTVQTVPLSEIWGWRLDRPGAVLLSVEPGPGRFTPVSWSPDGERLLVEEDYGADSRLSLLHAGSGELDGGRFPENAEGYVAWIGNSPWKADGTHVAYHVSWRVSETGRMESRVVDLRTGEEVALDGQFVAWSPDGSRLLYATYPDPETQTAEARRIASVGDFFVANRDGGGPEWIGRGHGAAWARDSERIALVDSEGSLQVLNTETGVRTTVLDGDDLSDATGLALPASLDYGTPPSTLAWSPDGEDIAAAAYRMVDDTPEEGAILLVQEEGYRVLRREAGATFHLAWAPQGKWLTALIVGSESFRTVVMTDDGSTVLETKQRVGIWSPQRPAIALTKFPSDDSEIRIVDLESGEEQTVDVPGQCLFPIWNPRSPLGP